MNAAATAKHCRLLEAINSGKVAHLALGGFASGSSFSNANSYSPTVNVNDGGGMGSNPREGARFAGQIADAVQSALGNSRPDTFRRNPTQAMAHAFQSMSRSHARNG